MKKLRRLRMPDVPNSRLLSRAKWTLRKAQEESRVNDFILFVFKANGDNDIAPKEYTKMPDDSKVAELEITTDAKEIYIIANTKATATTNEVLLAVANKSDLQAAIGRDFDSPSATGIPSQTSTNLWMAGQNDAPFTPVEGGNVSVSVTLKYLAAKLRITSVTVSDEVVADLSSKLTFSNVVVFNGAAATRFIPADGKRSLIPTHTPVTATRFYVSGMLVNFANKPTIVGRNNEYSYTLTGDMQIATTPTAKNQHYFYVFENDGLAFESQPTMVTLKAVDDNSDDVFYSVFFKMDDADAPEGYDNKVIEPGKSYDISMTIKKMGSKDPTIPALKTTVDVTITPASWQTVTIEKTFE